MVLQEQRNIGIQCYKLSRQKIKHTILLTALYSPRMTHPEAAIKNKISSKQ